MRMKRVRLTLVLALLALSAFSLPAVAGDPDSPQVTKRLAPAPDSDRGHGRANGWQQIWWIGSGWVSVYLGRWFAR
jgi:hypothetical protein